MSSGVFNQFTGYHNRKSIRLRGYDYSLPGAYFVTVCAHDREQKLFGDVIGGKMIENDYGNTVRNCWNDLPSHYPHIRLDEFVIMPNHVHGIVIIRESAFVGARSSRPMELPSAEMARSSRQFPDNTGTYGTGIGHDDRNTGRGDNKMGRDDRAPTGNPTLGNIVAYFKYQSTKQINAIRQHGIKKIWQRNYYDHIVRDEKSHYRIRQYIHNNPANWTVDSENHLDNEFEMFDRMGQELNE